MDSINKQQPEHNHEDLGGAQAAAKIKELAEASKSCFFCTETRPGLPFATRPMAVQKVDDEGNLWFLSASDSHKNAEIAIHDHVQLLFQGSHFTDFMSIFGRATITTDKEKIKELWEPLVKNWFTGGIDDPRITVIKVEPGSGYYWDTKHGIVVAFAKQVAGMLTGKTLDDSIEGMLRL